ncbi:antibiotic biosynthesis monooxygenase family protein [Bacillus massiliigorillae]|uniref:antibiotic biosynthesis monooxygenase family protein n=1 Tax=Bacillus massiliigorillae TaxID=1243664 RepID=UPI00039BC6CE|nr:antibiotic biosynthesis monooxygenase [Bacillus massiliigorillae]
MNIYMTSGTFEYLRQVKLKNANEQLILLHSADKTILLQETNEPTLFKHPRKYEIVDGIGDLKQEGFVIMNNIPVSEESRPTFEHMFKNRAGKVEEQPGFQALRVLRPVGFETYIILTQWHTESAFDAWQRSKSFQDAHSQKPAKTFTNSSQKIFSGEAFVTKFFVPTFEKE